MHPYVIALPQTMQSHMDVNAFGHDFIDFVSFFETKRMKNMLFLGPR